MEVGWKGKEQRMVYIERIGEWKHNKKCEEVKGFLRGWTMHNDGDDKIG